MSGSAELVALSCAVLRHSRSVPTQEGRHIGPGSSDA